MLCYLLTKTNDLGRYIRDMQGRQHSHNFRRSDPFARVVNFLMKLQAALWIKSFAPGIFYKQLQFAYGRDDRISLTRKLFHSRITNNNAKDFKRFSECVCHTMYCLQFLFIVNKKLTFNHQQHTELPIDIRL